MANVHDVAAYILAKRGSMTTWKLQKLVYYSQAWSLVWDEKPLFSAHIQAWANGPVVPELYRVHRGQFKISSWPQGNRSKLDGAERDTVDAVLKFYGDRPPQWLSDLTHREEPWLKARVGLGPQEPGNRTIKLGDMADYYGRLK